MVFDLVELVNKSKNGDEDAMAAIVTNFKQLIFTIAYRLIGDYDMSMDICQETFIKAFQNLDKLKNPEKFKTWLCSIARNLAYDRLREATKILPTNSEQNPNPQELHMVEDVVTGSRKRVIIQNALNKLEPRDRLLLTLYYYQNFSIKEIAEIVGITPENVKVSLSRARIKLRKELQGYEEELLS
ncbi:MAG: sigma-70 family RNA polymerase sigma factor [bacterium]|nr:sigma-70 family RNA polymerase sigma factor [bacterium]